MKRIWNYTVPANDAEHILLVAPHILPTIEIAWEEEVRVTSVTVKLQAAVRFWVEKRDGIETRNFAFLVVGTGQEIKDHWEYVGTTPRSKYEVIYHLYRRPV